MTGKTIIPQCLLSVKLLLLFGKISIIYEVVIGTYSPIGGSLFCFERSSENMLSALKKNRCSVSE